jgi:hypothetical protein
MHMKISIGALRTAAIALMIASLGGGTVAYGDGINLFPKTPKHHPAHVSKKKKKKKKTPVGPRGPRGPRGATGAQGPQGLQGSQGPAGPGAFKFAYVGPPTVNDPEHNVLPTGPFQLGVSCLPGTGPGDVGFKVYVTIPERLEYTQTLESLTEPPPQNAPSVTMSVQPAQTLTTQTTNIENGKNSETWATALLTNPATGVSTWLEIWYGATTGAEAHCFMSGIEI